MAQTQATTPATSGVKLDKKTLKPLNRRSDRHGLVFLGGNLALLGLSGVALHLSLGSLWVVPAMVIYGGILTTWTYALSHECAHGTAFRSRWLNEALFWITSLIYIEEPNHRRWAHARHHTYTWIREMDAQMPWETPMTLKGYLVEVSGLELLRYEFTLLFRHAFGRFDDAVRDYTPESELPKLKWGARAFLAIYGGSALAILWTGALWPLIYIVLPRLIGAPVMHLITLVQHAEMEENQPDIRTSTRSVKTNWLVNLMYWNMSYHREHHLYPTVPFHALPKLHAEVRESLPTPSPGMAHANWHVLTAVLRRGVGKAPVAQQSVG